MKLLLRFFLLLGIVNFLVVGKANSKDKKYDWQIKEGAIGIWHLDENADDASEHKNNGEVYGDPIWVKGKYGSALQFTGDSQDYVEVPCSDSLNTNLSSYTFSFWLVPSSVVHQEDLIGFGYDGSKWGYCLVKYGNDLKLTFQDSHGTWITHYVTYTFLKEAGNWVFITVTWDGKIWKFYKNGDFLADWHSSTKTGAEGSLFKIGMFGWGPLTGRIDEVCVYNRALSDAEVKAIFKGVAVAEQKQVVKEEPKPASKPVEIKKEEKKETLARITKDLPSQLNLLKKELRRAYEEGYDTTPIEILLKPEICSEIMDEAKINVEESRLSAIRRAKGMLISLKLPKWAHECRFIGKWKDSDIENFPSQDLSYFGREWGEWFCVARPTYGVLNRIDKWHAQKKRVAFYIENCLSPITMVLMPERSKWYSSFSKKYVSQYWHYGEEWWGFSGGFPEFQKWMATQIELLARIGFDAGFLDSSLSTETQEEQDILMKSPDLKTAGGWVELQGILKKYPKLVLFLNNLGNTFIDDSIIKYNTIAVSEIGLFSPEKVFTLSSSAYNSPLGVWCYTRLLPSSNQEYIDLAYAVSISHKINVCGSDLSPAPKIREFIQKYSDYIYHPANEIYISQERMKSIPSGIKYLISQRHLSLDKRLLIVHLYNTSLAEKKMDIGLTLDLSNINLPQPSLITYLTAENEPVKLKGVKTGSDLNILVPNLWGYGVIVIGEPIFPRIEEVEQVPKGWLYQIKVAKNIGEFMLPLKIKNIDKRKWIISFNVPKGWKVIPQKEEITEDKDLSLSISVPGNCKEGIYAITPIFTDENGNFASVWPIQIEITSPLTFKYSPAFGYRKGKKTIKLRVTNNTDKKIDNLNLKVEFPKGWIDSEVYNVQELEPKKSIEISLLLNLPLLKDAKLWDFKDFESKINWSFGKEKGEEILSFRVFPTSIYVFPGDVLGIFKEIAWYLSGFPELRFIKGRGQDALSFLEAGNPSVIWLRGDDKYYRSHRLFRGSLKEFLKKGGGVIMVGKIDLTVDLTKEEVELLPVEIGEECEKENLKLVQSPITKDIYNLKKEFSGKFKALKIKPKEWGEVIATWGDGTPAIVISKKPDLKVAYVSSYLEGDYDFGEGEPGRITEKWDQPSNLWLIKALYYELFRWASLSLE